ncbi:MAG: cupin domain-containing protein [Phreatobacter sp.]|uniref:cupin domain-containing protein n=1 Tax=Phreatobacter sp. TaxID=1966341 RepID=UPI0027349713|nr:cupin domain-containing protein [Phreatobacter sp.]MDP2800458.1 cupin domain-containing protein [Phreatobacter sp.]
MSTPVEFPDALVATKAAPRTRPSNYPEPFFSRMGGREKRPLGDVFGLTNFGVNLTRIVAGAVSALHHSHSRQDEFVYMLEGELVLIVGDRETLLTPGMCAGFARGGEAHHLVNRSQADATYLEIGDRSTGDVVTYPGDDIAAILEPDGRWVFTHKDGTPY